MARAHALEAVRYDDHTHCDWYLYKERHVIECMFGKLTYYRRIATHFEKKAHHFKEMLAFAAVLL